MHQSGCECTEATIAWNAGALSRGASRRAPAQPPRSLRAASVQRGPQLDSRRLARDSPFERCDWGNTRLIASRKQSLTEDIDVTQALSEIQTT